MIIFHLDLYLLSPSCYRRVLLCVVPSGGARGLYDPPDGERSARVQYTWRAGGSGTETVLTWHVTWYSPLPARLVGFGECGKMARMMHVRCDVYCVELTLFYLGYKGICGYPTQLSACPS